MRFISPSIGRRVPFLVLLLLASPLPALAQKAPPPKQEGTAEAAFVGTSGNSSTSTFSLGAEHIARPDSWVIKNRALMVRSQSDGDVTAESILYALRTEHALTSRLSMIAEYGYFRDVPAGVSNRHSASGGLAVKIADNARQTFVADAGFGYLNEHRLTGTNVSSATYNGGSVYKLKLSDTAALSDEARLLGAFNNSSDWRLAHTIALTAKLTTVLSLKVSNVIRYAHFPPPGFKTTDSTTSVALVASFKRQ